MNNEITRIANDLEEKLRKTTAERNVFKAKYRSLITLMERMRSELRQITDHIEDEGDRVYFGSTNHADTLEASSQLRRDVGLRPMSSRRATSTRWRRTPMRRSGCCVRRTKP